jgi:hypothetical protein
MMAMTTSSSMSVNARAQAAGPGRLAPRFEVIAPLKSFSAPDASLERGMPRIHGDITTAMTTDPQPSGYEPL